VSRIEDRGLRNEYQTERAGWVIRNEDRGLRNEYQTERAGWVTG
jgi:hypothetical protein